MIVREAHLADAKRLGPALRDADKAEVYASTGQSGKDALETGITASALCHTVLDDDGVPMGIFGVVPDLQTYSDLGLKYGYVWLLGSPALISDRREFMRQSRAWLKTLCEDFDFLGNFVDARNGVHIKWLQALGFEFLDVVPDYGYERRPFIEFQINCQEAASV